jgi:hypothetical protein
MIIIAVLQSEFLWGWPNRFHQSINGAPPALRRGQYIYI